LREVNIRQGNDAAAPRSVHECQDARLGATDGYRGLSARDNTGIQYDPREVMESRFEKVRLSPACPAVDESVGIGIQRSDSTLVVRDRASYARQTRRERNHRTFANKLMRQRLFISFYLR